jgi:hypothetical protein
MAVRVRIGFSGAPREVQIEVESGDALIEEIGAAQEAGNAMIWVTDTEGERHGIVIEKIAYIEVSKEQGRSGVGFSAE